MFDPPIGKQIGQFRIDSILGRGGMGVVYRAHDVDLDRDVALKMLSPALAGDDSFLRRLRSEAQAVARVKDHTHIVRVHELGESELGLYIAMECIEGGSLRELVRLDYLPWTEAIPIIRQCLLALESAHEAKVIHRDVKPGNILLTKKRSVKITDFGLAKIVESDLTRSNEVSRLIGSIRYLSPEQIANPGKVDHRCDLYSLGMTMYRVLSGELPFIPEANEYSILKSIVDDPIGPITKQAIPPDLQTFVDRALEKNRDRRFQSAKEMLEALDDVTGGMLTTVLPVMERAPAIADQMPVPSEEEVLPLADRVANPLPDREDPEATIELPIPAATMAPPPEPEPEPEAAPRPAAAFATASADALDAPISAPPLATHEERKPSPARWPVLAALLIGVAWLAWAGLSRNAPVAETAPSVTAADTAPDPLPMIRSVLIDSEPAGAWITINDSLVGTTPFSKKTQELDAGDRVRIELDGHEPAYGSLQAGPNGALSFPLTVLRRLTASLAVLPDPSDAEITINGWQYGSGPLTVDTLSPGLFEVRVARSGYWTHTESVDLATGMADSILVSLKKRSTPAPQNTEPARASRPEAAPKRGQLLVRSKGSGLVLVDKRAQANKPLTLVPGAYLVECGRGETAVRRQVTVTAGSKEELTCHFEATVRIVTVDQSGTEVAEGSISINGNRTKYQTPAQLVLGTGEHRIVSWKQGYPDTVPGFRTIVVGPSFEPVEKRLMFVVKK